MAEIDSVARVVINVRESAIARRGFGIPLILSHHTHTPGLVKSYARWEDMLADGFAQSDSAVRQARAIKAAGISTVEKFVVGKLQTAPPAKVVTLAPSIDVKSLFSTTINGQLFSAIIYKYTPTVANSTLYTVTINGVPYSFASDASATAAEVATGIAALINADASAPVTAANNTGVLVITARSGKTPADVRIVTTANLGAPAAPTAAEAVAVLTALINASTVPVTASGTSTLTLTADAPGEPYALETSDNFATTETTTWDTAALAALTSDLIAIRAADPSWYVVLADGSSTAEILALAAAVEAMESTLLFAATSDAGVLSGESTTDVGAVGEAAGYKRTTVMHTDHPGTYPMATLAGVALPRSAGSITFSYKTLPGQKPREYSAEEITQLEARNMMRYTTVSNAPVTRNGKTLSGRWIDITIGIDFVKARIQEEVLSAFLNVGKIPMTQKGAEAVGDAVRLALKAAVSNGIIAEDWNVEVPDVSKMSPIDRQNRVLTPVTWSARFTGAIESVYVEGDVIF